MFSRLREVNHLSSFHDLLCFCIEVEISPQGFEQHLCPDPHPLTVDVSKLLDAAKHKVKLSDGRKTPIFIANHAVCLACFQNWACYQL